MAEDNVSKKKVTFEIDENILKHFKVVLAKYGFKQGATIEALISSWLLEIEKSEKETLSNSDSN